MKISPKFNAEHNENLRITSFSPEKMSRKKNGDTFAPVEVSRRINNHILLSTSGLLLQTNNQ